MALEFSIRLLKGDAFVAEICKAVALEGLSHSITKVNSSLMSIGATL